MNAKQIPASELKAGMQVKTSGGVRTVTQVGPYSSFGHEMLGWSWKPEIRADGLRDCGYSGVAVGEADRHMVKVL